MHVHVRRFLSRPHYLRCSPTGDGSSGLHGRSGTHPDRPDLGLPLCGQGSFDWMMQRSDKKSKDDGRTNLAVAGAGRKPDAAAWPEAGLTDGWGPNRGLKAGLGAGGGALGFVDVTNWGLVKFKHALNSTVDPRYWEHLKQNPVGNGCTEIDED